MRRSRRRTESDDGGGDDVSSGNESADPGPAAGRRAPRRRPLPPRPGRSAAAAEFGHAELARGKAADPVLRTELVRARNRLEGALLDVVELSGAARAKGE